MKVPSESPASGGLPLWRSAAALVFVDDPDAPQLSEAEAHHLGRVLRLRQGDDVCVSDGSGRWRLCWFEGDDKLVVGDPHGVEARPEPVLTVGFAVVKGDKPDLVVQKLTEVGIDRIVLFHGRRSIARWQGDKVERNLERLRRVVTSACSQSRRLHIPTVEFSELRPLIESGAAVADFGGRTMDSGDTTVLIGPEGGWEQQEYGDAPTVDLGRNVLRAETAAISAAVQMCMLRDRVA